MKHLLYTLKLTIGYCFVWLVLLTISCTNSLPTSKHPGNKSKTTGQSYNKKDGFQVKKFKGQLSAPNMAYIEGGMMVMGPLNEGLLQTESRAKRTVSVASFYMEQTVTTNIAWREYLYDIKKDSVEDVYTAALPDTAAWARELAYNDPYIEQYLRFPGFNYYPVVGVSWSQAKKYCEWRTKAVNQHLSRKAGKKYGIEEGGTLPIESGLILPDFRLPTEAEWEHAALAMVGTQSLDFVQGNQRVYPWDGLSMRKTKGKEKGRFRANFKRGRGNYKGIAGESDSNGATSYVYQYPPNDFGLYDMAGNVNEWVYDLYRPLSFQDFDDFNPVRRDDSLDSTKDYDPKNSLINNKSRIYKGGSWKDVAYWLAPGTRRFIDEDSSTATIGFRCAMTSASSDYSKR